MAIKSNRIVIEPDSYHIEYSETPVVLTFVDSENQSSSVSREYADSVELANGRINMVSPTIMSDKYTTDFSLREQKIVRFGSEYYRVGENVEKKETPTITEQIEYGCIVANGFGNQTNRILFSYGSSLTVVNGRLTIEDEQDIYLDYPSFNSSIFVGNYYHYATDVFKIAKVTKKPSSHKIQLLKTLSSGSYGHLIDYADGDSVNYYDASGSYIGTITLNGSNPSLIESTLIGKYIDVNSQVRDKVGRIIVESKDYFYAFYGYKVSIAKIRYTVNIDSYPLIVKSPMAEGFVFENDEIASISGEKTVNLSGDELSIDTFTPEVFFDVIPKRIFKPTDYDGIKTDDGLVFCGHYTSDLRKIMYGYPIDYYHDDRFIGRFYIKNIERIARNQYRLNAMSIIGLLDMQYHVGGIYLNTTFGSILAEILGNMVVTVQDEVANTVVTGWLPYDTCRNNLHQLMFATNAVLLKSDSGDLIFTYMPSNATPTPIEDGRVYDSGTVEYVTPCSKVEVTEHTFEDLDSTDPVLLFDNTDAAAVTNKRVLFRNAPIKVDTLETTGTLVIERNGTDCGVNYAIVTGQGTLTGVPYVHIQHTIEVVNPYASEERVVTSDGDTLISVMNSENVANRLLSYYSSARKINAGVKIENERVGSRYSLKDAFSESANAYLSKIGYTVSSFIKGDCEFIAGYNPSTSGNNYSDSVLLTGIGTWTSPKTGKIRVTLIGGGNGGSSGYAGGVIEGGSPGQAGQSGKIYSFEMNVTEGQKISYNCGAGGLGGSQCSSHDTNNAGSAGGNTTFGAYSSATGGTVSTGFMDIFTGDIYALPGTGGVAGGDGGHGGNESNDYRGESGGSVTLNGITYYGGSPGSYASMDNYSLNGFNAPYNNWKDPLVGGGGGGGAAVGNNGKNGGNARATKGTKETRYVYLWEYDMNKQIDIYNLYGVRGDAADGADAIGREEATNYGQGGNAGHGGGGAGSAGEDYNDAHSSSSIFYENNEFYNLETFASAPYKPNGRGGKGGRGGNGGNGIILIYV